MPNVADSPSRPRPPPGSRACATTRSWCASRPAQRSTSVSSASPPTSSQPGEAVCGSLGAHQSEVRARGNSPRPCGSPASHSNAGSHAPSRSDVTARPGHQFSPHRAPASDRRASPLKRIDDYLARWAMRKYKRLRGHKRRAYKFLKDVARRQPNLFVHWRLGLTPWGWVAGAR